MGFLINVELHFRTRAKSPGDDPTLRWINREDWVQAPPAGRPMGRPYDGRLDFCLFKGRSSSEIYRRFFFAGRTRKEKAKQKETR